MPTPNEVLQDRAIRHAVYLQRFSSGIVNRMIGLLNKTDRDLLDQIAKRLEKIEARGFDLGARSTERLTSLLGEIRTINKAAYDQVSKELTAELRDLASYEADWQLGNIQGVMGVSANLASRPPLPLIRSAAMSRPFQGRLLKEWLAGVESGRAQRVRDAIRMGIVEGQTTDQIIRRLRGTRALNYADGLLDMERRRLATMVRTAVSHTAGVARDLVYEENADVLDAVQWLSTLDGRTTHICIARDLKKYTTEGHKPIGHNLPWLGGPGRAHFNCRSTSIPVLKNQFLQGFVDQTERASSRGPVNGGTSYPDWLKRQSPSVQDDVLGKPRGKQFRDGKLPVKSFTPRTDADLTLPQLQKLDPPAPPKFEIPEFTPLTSVASTTQWAQNNLARSVSLSPTAKMSGLNAMLQAVQEVNARFSLPSLNFIGDPAKSGANYKFNAQRTLAGYGAKLDHLIFKAKPTEDAALKAHSAKSAPYVANKYPVSSIVQTIRDIHKNPELAKLAEQMSDRVWSVYPGSRGVAVHEMGHRLDALTPGLRDLATKGYNEGWKYMVSVYGQTNAAEFVAESFAMYIKNDPRERFRLYPPLLELFERLDRLKS